MVFIIMYQSDAVYYRVSFSSTQLRSQKQKTPLIRVSLGKLYMMIIALCLHVRDLIRNHVGYLEKSQRNFSVSCSYHVRFFV